MQWQDNWLKRVMCIVLGLFCWSSSLVENQSTTQCLAANKVSSLGYSPPNHAVGVRSAVLCMSFLWKSSKNHLFPRLCDRFVLHMLTFNPPRTFPGRLLSRLMLITLWSECQIQATPRLSEDKVKQCVDPKLKSEYPAKAVAKVRLIKSISVQTDDNSW